MQQRRRVRLFSESAFTVRGHGVHSIYEEQLQAVSSMADTELVSGVRSCSPAVILNAHTAGPVALARILVHRGPVIVTAHITPASFLGSIRGARYFLKIVSIYLKFVYNRADIIIAVSAATAREIEALGLRPPVQVSHNAIDHRQIEKHLAARAILRQKFDWQAETVVLAVGQIQPRKGIEDFIECARALPRFRFVWVGGMPFGPASAERKKMLGLPARAPRNVTFTGMKERAEVYEYYAASDVFFLPARHETFGLAVLEAATAGLPIVVRDLPCYREWLSGGYLSGTTVGDYLKHLETLTQPDFRASQGGRASQVARGYGGQRLVSELRETFDAATQSARHPGEAQMTRRPG